MTSAAKAWVTEAEANTYPDIILCRRDVEDSMEMLPQNVKARNSIDIKYAGPSTNAVH